MGRADGCEKADAGGQGMQDGDKVALRRTRSVEGRGLDENLGMVEDNGKGDN